MVSCRGQIPTLDRPSSLALYFTYVREAASEGYFLFFCVKDTEKRGPSCPLSDMNLAPLFVGGGGSWDGKVSVDAMPLWIHICRFPAGVCSLPPSFSSPPTPSLPLVLLYDVEAGENCEWTHPSRQACVLKKGGRRGCLKAVIPLSKLYCMVKVRGGVKPLLCMFLADLV